ncbi:hypothetical protein ACLKA7_002151 [Drosophila subpalustris]
MGNASSSSHSSGGGKSSRKCRSLPNSPDVRRQIAPAYGKVNGGTAIPLPATVMVQRRCPPDKVRPLPPTPNHTPSIPGLGKSGSDFTTSRPNSPPTSNHTIQSLKSGNNNSLRPPSVKSNHQSGIPSPSSHNAVAPSAPQKHSMLDKLKLFNKEKQQNVANATAAANKTQMQIQSKRTSSSSGFSSARSERSDSSLSLNDGHNSQLKPPSISVSAQKSQQKHNTKQSKLLAAQQKKDQSKPAKLDKKEKSPARSLHKEEQQQLSGNESRSSTMGRASKSSLARGSVEKNTAKTSSKSSLHSKSDSLKGQSQSQQLLHSPSGTGLPKPIAAIKGTSKLPQPGNLAHGTGELFKRESSDISANQANSISQEQQQQMAVNQATHILKALPSSPAGPAPPGPAPPPYYANAPPPPPPHASQMSQGAGYLSEPSTPQHGGIYGSSRLPPPKSALSGAPRKLEYNAGPHILSSPPSRSLPLQRPTHNSAPNTPTASPSKFHTIPSKIVGTIYESKEEQLPPSAAQSASASAAASSVLPMRPLLRGYNSHVTLPTRGSRQNQHHHPHQSYLDFCESDLGQGYCSDGDALRVGSSTSGSRYHDIDNGYLSEGSSGLSGTGSGSGAAGHGKHFLSMMRARTQLPTTIEERIRSSRGSLDSIGTAANGSSAASQASSSGSGSAGSTGNNINNNNNNNNNNNGNNKMEGSPHHRPGSRNGRDNWTKMPEPFNGHKVDKSEKSSPSRRTMGGGGGGGGCGSGSSSKQGSPSASSRTKGVPPSFGYVKRANGSIASTAEQQNIAMLMASGGAGAGAVNGLPCGRTAHVSAVPRTANGRKVTGGTQTLPNDMNKLPPNTQHRSFSLTGPTATQLSQSIRERLATGSHSLPKPGSDMHVFQHRVSTRAGGTRHDGSLSDTQTYAEVKPEYSSYAMWLKHSNTAGSRLSDGDAIDQMQIGSPAMTRHGQKMIHNRSSGNGGGGAGAAAGQMPVQGNESPYVQSPRMNRSNSIRSTKSEKMYPSMLSRGCDVDIEPYYCLPVGTNGVLSAQMAAAVAQAQAQAQAHAAQAQVQVNMAGNVAAVAWSQPTSPTPLNRGPFAAAASALSPTHATAAHVGVGGGGGSNNITASHRLTYPKKNDEVHGSAASLLSGGSSLYGSAEERQAHEIRRLKRELQDAREQVLSLSSQLSTNVSVIPSSISFIQELVCTIVSVKPPLLTLASSPPQLLLRRSRTLDASAVASAASWLPKDLGVECVIFSSAFDAAHVGTHAQRLATFQKATNCLAACC